MMFSTAPSSLTMYPVKPHSLRAMLVSSSLLAHEGTPLMLYINKKANS